MRAWLAGARVGAPVGTTTVTIGADLLSGDDGPGDAAHDMRTVAEPPDFPQDSGLLFPADVGFEDDDHDLVDGGAL